MCVLNAREAEGNLLPTTHTHTHTHTYEKEEKEPRKICGYWPWRLAWYSHIPQSGKSHQLTPWYLSAQLYQSWTSSLQNCERTCFCCMPPNLWQFITATTGNSHMLFIAVWQQLQTLCHCVHRFPVVGIQAERMTCFHSAMAGARVDGFQWWGLKLCGGFLFHILGAWTKWVKDCTLLGWLLRVLLCLQLPEVLTQWFRAPRASVPRKQSGGCIDY
jgi:hypothetical protein